MRVAVLPQSFYRAAALQPVEFSAQAEQRLRDLRRWRKLRASGFTATEAAALLELPRSTLYRLDRRYRADGARGLEPRSRQPHRRRQPTWSAGLMEAVRQQRERPPCYGKDKIAVILRREGWPVSTSTVGRILGSLKRRGALREPPRPGVARRKRRVARPYAVRKPKEYQPSEPGDLVQVDGGSEFQGEFEQACRDRAIRLFVLPPHSPKLNGHVECAHRTHQEEFYEEDSTVTALPPQQRQRERCYNTERPHHSLGWQSPRDYLLQHHPGTVPPALSHMP